jgi:competence protein ComEC
MKVSIILLLGFFCISTSANQKLSIHYINVGQGGSTLIIGPNGSKILYDFGKKNGADSIVPYLNSLGFGNNKVIEYSILSHRDLDHFYGYKGVVDSGFDFTVANYGPGGPPKEGTKLESNWKNSALDTTAGAIRDIPVGLNISLGDGAEMLVVASNGRIFDGSLVKVKNENDRSVSLLIRYNNFQYILDGDLGGGKESCSSHVTSQKNVQTPIAQALLSSGLLDVTHGVDIMHVAHHGSESSSPSSYVSKIKPEVAIISVGNPNCSYRHPRENVINTLRGNNSCTGETKVTTIFQTDEGSEGCSRETVISRTDNSSIIGGDIVISTDGVDKYSISTSGVLWKNKKREQVLSPKVHLFDLDETK